jgi:hypothetical protein
MAETTMTSTGTGSGTPTRLAPAFPMSPARGYQDLWQRELDVAELFAQAWTATLRWMGAAYAARWPGSVGWRVTAGQPAVDRSGPDGAQSAETPSDEVPTATVTATLITGEVFDDAVHLLVDDDLCATVMQRIAP